MKTARPDAAAPAERENLASRNQSSESQPALSAAVPSICPPIGVGVRRRRSWNRYSPAAIT
jgi:hypothetical protein